MLLEELSQLEGEEKERRLDEIHREKEEERKQRMEAQTNKTRVNFKDNAAFVDMTGTGANPAMLNAMSPEAKMKLIKQTEEKKKMEMYNRERDKAFAAWEKARLEREQNPETDEEKQERETREAAF